MINFTIAVVAAVIPFAAEGAVEDSLIVSRVLDYYEKAGPERMIIETGKDSCEPGEKLGFRAYVVREADNFDSGLTNFIYLDLYSNNGWSRISHKKYIRNENGSFLNYVEFPADLSPGDYTIVGYTQHMLGFPAESYAYKTVRVVAGGKSGSQAGDYTLELMPEGGRYVEGVVQKVGVRVSGDRQVAGVFHVEVADSAGHVTYKAETDVLGYAVVKVRNDSLTRQCVRVSLDDGRVLTARLPEAEANCAALKVNRGESQLGIDILTHGDVDLSEMNVVVRASGVVFSMAADKAHHIKLPLQSLPDGDIDIDLVDYSRKEVVSSRRIHKRSENLVEVIGKE